MFGKNLFEFAECGDRLLGRCDRTSIERLEITARPPRRSVQEGTHNEAKYKPIASELAGPGTVGRWTLTGSYAANDGLAERVRCDSSVKRARLTDHDVRHLLSQGTDS